MPFQSLVPYGSLMYRLLPARPFHTLTALVLAMIGATAVPLWPSPAAAAATPVNGFWIADGTVYSSALSGSTLYIGGGFNYVGPDTGPAALLDIATGNPASFPGVNGPVYTAIPDGAGGIYMGGVFNFASNVSVTGLAHLKPDTTDPSKLVVDTAFTPTIAIGSGQYEINSLILSGSTLYVGGRFDTVDGTARSNIAAVDAATGSLIAAWNPDADGVVHSMALSLDGTTLYAGGEFANIGGAARNGVAALDANVADPGAAVAGWDADAGSGGVVDTLALSHSGSLYLGGTFTTVGGTPRGNIAKVAAADGTLDGGWNPGANAAVNALRLDATEDFLFVGGAFNTSNLAGPSLGGASREYLGKVDASTGQVDTTWTPAADGPVQTMELVNSSLAVGGSFTTVSGTKRNDIAGINATTGVVTTWNPSAQNTVRTLKLVTVSGANILFAGGDFISAGGKVRHHVAALNATTGAATDWDPNVNNIVTAIAPSAAAVFIGGNFTAVGGHARTAFAALDNTSGQVLSNWDISFDNHVEALLLSGTTLYASGEFTVVGSSTRNHLAAFDTQTAALTPWAPSANDTVVSMAQQVTNTSTLLYVGGTFTSIGGVTRNRLAALDGTSGALTAWDPNVDAGNGVNPNDGVGTMVLSTGGAAPVLYVGGGFSNIGGSPRSDIAAINTDDNGTLVTWDPNADNADGQVRSLALSSDNAVLYAGGDFTAVGGQTGLTGLAALTTADGKATSWDPQLSTTTSPLAVTTLAWNPAGELYAGGHFTAVSNVLRYSLAAFQAPVTSASPAGGAYSTGQTVTLTCTDQAGNACTDNVLYSTDGSAPSVPYSTGLTIPVNATTTLKFFGTDSEGMRESIESVQYIIDQTPPVVSADPPGGTYTSIQNVTLKCTDSGGSGCANVYYTTDGSSPTLDGVNPATGATRYVAPVSLDNDTVLKFYAVDAAGNAATVQQESYTIDAFSPVTTPSPAPGTYTTPQQVSLSCDDQGGFGCNGTFFTTDGTTPTTSSTRYTQPILIDQNTTLNYFSIDNAGHQESPTTAVYLIQTGVVVTSGGGLFLPPAYLVGAWLLVLGRILYMHGRRGDS